MLRLLKRLAKQVDKEEFLKQLKEQWRPLLKSTDVGVEGAKAYARIRQSKLKDVFDIVGVTQEDIKKVVQELVSEHGKEVIKDV